MKHKRKPNRMTLDRLAASMQRELLGVGKKYDRLDERVAGVEHKVVGLDQKLVALDHKIDRVQADIVDEVHKENLKVLESNDRVATKLDRLLEDAAAHDALHKRLENSVHNHEVRIKKLEQVRR
jgi:predicted  nucleic acid-binding Zn-ribbon protein